MPAARIPWASVARACWRLLRAVGAATLLLVLAVSVEAGVLERQKISATVGGLSGPLEPGDRFGSSAVALGDLDGDGRSEIAVGSPLDDTGGPDRGAVWLLFPEADGTVGREVRLAEGLGLRGLRDGDAFGSAVAAPGDLDGDSVFDLVVGAPFADAGGRDRGAIHVLLLTSDGNVKRHFAVDVASLGGAAADFDHFGRALGAVGDLDGDPSVEIAVGAPGDDTAGPDRGALWILDLDSDGVTASRRITEGEGGFVGPLADGDGLGGALLAWDLQPGAGARLAVGAPSADGGGLDRGAVWVLSLDATGAVVGESRLDSASEGGPLPLEDQDLFGSSLVLVSADADTTRIAVGAPGDRGISSPTAGGSIWLLTLDGEAQGVDAHRIRPGEGGFEGELDVADGFGRALAHSVEGSTTRLWVGTPGDDDGGADQGATWVLDVDEAGQVRAWRKVSDQAGGLASPLLAGDAFGSAAVELPGLLGDGQTHLLVGAPGEDLGGSDRGTTWLLPLRPDGTALDQRRIHPGQLGSSTELTDGDGFGRSIARLDEAGRHLAVGAPSDDSGEINTGAVWILRLSDDGYLEGARRISALDAPLAGLASATAFGTDVTSIGDLDGDGVTDLAVGAPEDFDGGLLRGAVWILFLDADDGLRDAAKISSTTGGFVGPIENFDEFGASVAGLGDLDGDGRPELAVGAPRDDDGVSGAGAVWILSLDPDGTVAAHSKISSTEGGLRPGLDQDDAFGSSITVVGDLDRDGIAELVVGARGDDAPDVGRGSVWLLYLREDATVRLQEQIFDGEGVLPTAQSRGYGFGAAGAGLADLDGDGIADLVVGAPGADDAAINAGAVWVHFLDGERRPRLIDGVATSRTSLRLEFDERMLASTAEDEARYTVVSLLDSAPLRPRAAGLQADGRTVELLLAEDMIEGPHRVTVEGLLDESGTSIDEQARALDLPVPPETDELELAAGSYRGFGLTVVPFATEPEAALRSLGAADGGRAWKLGRWSPGDGAYRMVGSEDLPLGSLVPGHGYWLITREAELLRVGGFSPPEEPFEIELEAGPGGPATGGWNQIANPFPYPVRVEDLWLRGPDGPVDLLSEENQLTSRGLRDGSRDGYPDLGAGHCLPPRSAVWIETLGSGEVSLVIPDLPVDTELCAPVTAEPALPAAADWMVVLRARQDGIAAEPLVLGATSGVSDALGLSAKALPPRPDATAPALFVVEAPASTTPLRDRRWARSFRSEDSTLVWQLRLVAARVPGQVEVRATTVGLEGAALWLEDEVAGARIALEEGSSWTVAATEGERVLRVVVEPGAGPRPSDVAAPGFARPYPNPFVTRTGFRFRVDAPAELRASVYDLAGRRVRRISRRAAAPGEHVLAWDGTDGHGHSVAAGTYLVRQRVVGGATATYRVLKLR